MPSKKAIRMREIIETAVQNLPEKDASEAVTLFPHLRGNDALVKAGTLIQFNGVVYRAASDLWDTQDNAPDKAPSLWAELRYRDGIRIIPDPITVTEAFAKGEEGWWGDTLYVSLTDANVYTPEQYPANWKRCA